MDKYLHIVCLDVPYPADYGGVFDLFYKIRTLHELGVKIHLHCFEYGRGRQPELDKYCTSVNYYKRNRGLKGLSFSIPYIVNSRKNELLKKRLLEDDHPILLEGIHCSYLLHDDQLKGRKVLVRLHNVEFEYYRRLADSATGFLQRTYFMLESRLLKKYERSIANKAMFIAVSEKDMETYIQHFGARNIQYLPVFLPFQTVTCFAGRGNFCLYHGNLSIPENEKAVIWLLEHVFDQPGIPFVIAGKAPSVSLSELVHQHEHCCLVSDPGDIELTELINKAQVHVLPSFNTTGVKIKLLNALFNGRHILINEQAAAGSGLDSLCHIAKDTGSLKELLKTLYETPFTSKEAESRKALLSTLFNNEENGQKLINWIWG